METKAYKEGWNASQAGNCTIFACPYLFGENHDQWIKGWRDNQKAWNSNTYNLPKFK
jgi:ribosome modulation factor